MATKFEFQFDFAATGVEKIRNSLSAMLSDVGGMSPEAKKQLEGMSNEFDRIINKIEEVEKGKLDNKSF